MESNPVEWHLYEPTFCAIAESYKHLVLWQGVLNAHSAYWLQTTVDCGKPLLGNCGFDASVVAGILKTAKHNLKRSKGIVQQLKQLGIASESDFTKKVPCWPWPLTAGICEFSEPPPAPVLPWEEIPDHKRRLYTIGEFNADHKRWYYQGPDRETYERIMAPERLKFLDEHEAWMQRRLEHCQWTDPGRTPASVHAEVAELIKGVEGQCDQLALESGRRLDVYKMNQTGKTHAAIPEALVA